MAERDTRKYEFLDSHGRIIREGITKRPLAERQRELRREEKQPKGRIRQVGYVVTEASARAWEKEQKKGTPPGGRP